MTTKTCPSCGTEVPESAQRCKQCFHDFNETVPLTRRLAGPLVLLGAFAAMAIVAVIALTVILSYPTEQKILVDEATQSIVTITQYRTRRETTRVKFDDVKNLEHVERMGEYEIRAITKDGEMTTIERSEQPLEGAAENYASLMGKPLTMSSELTGARQE
ncbi:MAG: hypothetical protein H0V89_06830 [Deltaproteobacteria bacterium]|nr:hypothetical protein [Deltaproteobacteria bacterium]